LADGSVVMPGVDSYFKLSEQRMTSVITAFEDKEAGGPGAWDGNKGIRYANDFELLAHYYTGQVRQMTKDEIANNVSSPYKELGYPEEWHTMMPETDAMKQRDLANKHVEEIGVDNDDGWFGSKDADLVQEAKASVSKFLWEFTESHKQYAKVKRAEETYQMISSNYKSPFQAKSYSHASTGRLPKDASGTGKRSALSPDERLQQQQDAKDQFDQVVKENNLNGKPDTMDEWARTRGFENDVTGAIEDYMSLGENEADRQAADMAYQSGKESYDVYDPMMSPSMQSSASLALKIKEIEPKIEKAYKDFIDQGGDRGKQERAKQLFMLKGERGYKTAKLNKEAVDLLKQLKVQANAVKNTNPDEYQKMQWWIKRFESKFSAGEMGKYDKKDKYANANSDILFGVYPDLQRPGWTKADEITELETRINALRSIGVVHTDEYAALVDKLKKTKSDWSEEQRVTTRASKKRREKEELEADLQEASRVSGIPIDVLREQREKRRAFERRATGLRGGAGRHGSSSVGALD